MGIYVGLDYSICDVIKLLIAEACIEIFDRVDEKSPQQNNLAGSQLLKKYVSSIELDFHFQIGNG